MAALNDVLVYPEIATNYHRKVKALKSGISALYIRQVQV